MPKDGFVTLDFLIHVYCSNNCYLDVMANVPLVKQMTNTHTKTISNAALHTYH